MWGLRRRVKYYIRTINKLSFKAYAFELKQYLILSNTDIIGRSFSVVHIVTHKQRNPIFMHVNFPLFFSFLFQVIFISHAGCT